MLWQIFPVSGPELATRLAHSRPCLPHLGTLQANEHTTCRIKRSSGLRSSEVSPSGGDLSSAIELLQFGSHTVPGHGRPCISGLFVVASLPQHSGQAMYVTTWPETWPHWLSALRMMFIFVGKNSLHLAITGRSCETTSRAIHAGAAFQCGIIIPGSTSGCALLDGRASSRSRLNNSCIRGPPCRHPLVGGSAKERQWYFKVLLKSGSQDAWSLQSSGYCVARLLLEVDFG